MVNSVYGSDAFSPERIQRRREWKEARAREREAREATRAADIARARESVRQDESVENRFTQRMRHQPDPGMIWRRALLDEQFIDEHQEPDRNSALGSVLNWMITTFLTAPMVVAQREDDEKVNYMPEHPASMLVSTPNPEYSWGVLMDFCLRQMFSDDKGSAFILKAREPRWMQTQALWALASRLVEPKGNDRVLITHYEYNLGGTIWYIPRDDVIHLRLGINAENMRYGRDPLEPLKRDLFADDEGARFSGSLLHNSAVPGVVLSPKNELAPPLATDEESAERAKERFRESFTGSGRGGVMLGESAMDVNVVSMSPNDMNFREIRKLPEERISGNLNVPAIVAGLGAGLDRSTFSNYAEAREAGYEEAIIHLQDSIAEQFSYQLLRKEFTDDMSMMFMHDIRRVRILQEDVNAKHQRVREDLLAGRITLGESYQLVGEDDSGLAEDEKNVRFVPTSVRVVKAGELATVDDMPELEPDEFDGAGGGGDDTGQDLGDMDQGPDTDEPSG